MFLLKKEEIKTNWEFWDQTKTTVFIENLILSKNLSVSLPGTDFDFALFKLWN